MNANIFFVIMLLTIGAVSSKRIRYQRCGSQARGAIISMDVTPCDQDPCVLRLGKQVTFSMKFIPRELVTSANIYAKGIKGSIPIPLPIKRNACQGYGLNCPLKAGVQAELVFSVKLPGFFSPRGKYGLEAYMNDQNENLVVCGKIDLKIALLTS